MKRHSPTYHAPRECPVCSTELVVTRLGCSACGSELAGTFENCQFCALDQQSLELLKVFLVSRGNLREVEKHLGVSYPTARLRFTELLSKLGLGDEPDPPTVLSREQILKEVTSGTLSPEEAAKILSEL